MSSTEQTRKVDKVISKQPSAKPAAEDPDILAQQPTSSATLTQRAQHDPKFLSSGDMLQLQRMIGNRATNKLLAGATPRPVIQAKLTVGAAHDPYEQEADHVADQVIAAPASTPAVQRLAEEEDLLQGKGPASEYTLHENNTGLPDNLKTGIESLSGASLDDVKVHYNSSQPAELNALAYAQGSDIHVAPGQEQHLPHEAWHIVQQAQGKVQPTMQMKDGASVNDDEGLEHEADVMGAKALWMTRSDQVATSSTLRTSMSLQPQKKAASSFPIQRMRVKFADVDDLEIDVPKAKSVSEHEKMREAIWRGVSTSVKVNQVDEDVLKCMNHLMQFEDTATVTIKYKDFFRWQGRWGPLQYAFTGRPKTEEAQPVVDQSVSAKEEEWKQLAIPVAKEQAGPLKSKLSQLGEALGRAKFDKPSEPNRFPGSEIASRISGEVSKFVTATKYDRMIFVEQFLAHYARLSQQKEVSVEEAFLSFAPSSDEALKTGGAHCSGQANSLNALLRSTYKLNCYLVPSVLQEGMAVPGGPPFGHAATVIPFETESEKGVVLCDPGFNLPIPFVLYVGKPVVYNAGIYTWEIVLGRDGEIHAKSMSKHGTAVAAYDANVAISNPDEAIAKPLAAVDTRLSIVKRDSKGTAIASVIVDLNKREVSLTAGNKRETIKFDEAGERIVQKKLVSSELAQLLDSNVETLNSRIANVLKNEGGLARLRESVYREKRK